MQQKNCIYHSYAHYLCNYPKTSHFMDKKTPNDSRQFVKTALFNVTNDEHLADPQQPVASVNNTEQGSYLFRFSKKHTVDYTTFDLQP
ncbi:hypothetical protein ACGVWS_02165 [Enterobacteriaceae bacterium LUAb1]